MAVKIKKKTVAKKEKKAPLSRKAAPAPVKKVSKPSGKAKKVVVATKKQDKKSPSVKKKTVKKPSARKVSTGKKPAAAAVPPKDRLAELRKSLILKKETILKEAKEEISKYVSGENKQLVETANDDGDWAQVDISEDLSLQRLSAHRKLLHNIDEAILKIAEGTYGICEECGVEISEKRLLVLPTATLCIDCQEQREQLEALEIEE